MSAKQKFIISMLLFGSIGIFVRSILLSSGRIALVRGVLGSIFLIIAAGSMRIKFNWSFIKKQLPLLLISGGAIGFNWILLFEAYRFTTIPNATLSYYFAPVFVLLLSPIVLKEHFRVIKVFCIITAMVGMLFILGIHENVVMEGTHLKGIGFGLLAAVLYALVILMNKFIKNISGMETTILQLGMASMVLLPYVLISDRTFVRTDFKSVILLTVIGFIHTGLAYLLYFSAIKDLKGQTIAVLSYIDPIAAVFMAGIFLGEGLGFNQIIGGVLILGATLLSSLKSKDE